MKSPLYRRCFYSFIALIVLNLGGVLGGVAQAVPIAAISLTGGAVQNPPSGVTDGWRFTLASDVTVTDLGYYDHNADGLAQSHDVGIFTDMGALLFSATVTPADLLDGLFRYTSIAPQTLMAGTYRIGGFRADGTDPVVSNATGFVTAADVSHLGGYFNLSGALAFPNTAVGGAFEPSIFGPNFKFETASVPAPATLALMGLGLACIGYRRKRKLAA